MISKEHLINHGLDISKASKISNLSFCLPSLRGRTIDEHFHHLGATVSEPWLELSNRLAHCKFPAMPANWVVKSGWTRYTPNLEPSPVLMPNEDDAALVFDVETLPKYTTNPIIAVAASERAWYVWLSPWIVGETDCDEYLIPLGTSMPRLIVGHNVSFDRARIYEEYSLRRTKTRFLDTMALHIAVNGMTASQRIAWNRSQKEKKASVAIADPSEMIARREDNQGMNFSSRSNTANGSLFAIQRRITLHSPVTLIQFGGRT